MTETNTTTENGRTVTVPYVTTGCYFKAGSYAQSNTDYGDPPEAYAEVQIRSLVVTHE